MIYVTNTVRSYKANTAGARNDLPQRDDGLTGAGELLLDGVGKRRPDDEDVADPHVEHAEHLVAVHPAAVRQEVEDRRHRPRVCLDDRVQIVRQHRLTLPGRPPPVMWAIPVTTFLTL